MPAGDKVRVLIVDDVADTRENVRKLLQFEGDIDVVGAARTAKEGIELGAGTEPGCGPDGHQHAGHGWHRGD